MFSTSQRIWGYETPDGSFAQFCKVQARQLMKRAQHLTWEESASYTLTLVTASSVARPSTSIERPATFRPSPNWYTVNVLSGTSVSMRHAQLRPCVTSGNVNSTTSWCAL